MFKLIFGVIIVVALKWGEFILFSFLFSIYVHGVGMGYALPAIFATISVFSLLESLLIGFILGKGLIDEECSFFEGLVSSVRLSIGRILQCLNWIYIYGICFYYYCAYYNITPSLTEKILNLISIIIIFAVAIGYILIVSILSNKVSEESITEIRKIKEKRRIQMAKAYAALGRPVHYARNEYGEFERVYLDEKGNYCFKDSHGNFRDTYD